MDSFKPDPKDCLDIILTDIQLHTQKIRKPHSLGRQCAKTINGSKNRRAYSNNIKIDEKSQTVTLSMSLGMEHLHDLARKQGKKYIRFFTREHGLPIFLGQDTVEKLESIDKRSCKRDQKM